MKSILLALSALFLISCGSSDDGSGNASTGPLREPLQGEKNITKGELQSLLDNYYSSGAHETYVGETVRVVRNSVTIYEKDNGLLNLVLQKKKRLKQLSRLIVHR